MRKILERNDPILKQKAQPIADKDFNSDWLKDLVDEMIAIMQEKGAVGILVRTNAITLDTPGIS